MQFSAILPNELSEQMIEAMLLQNIVEHGISLITQLASKERLAFRSGFLLTE